MPPPTGIEMILARLIPDAIEWSQRLQELAYDYVVEAVSAGARHAGRVYPQVTPTWDALNPQVVEWLNEYTELMAESVNATMQDQLRSVLIEGLESGANREQMQDAVMAALSPEATRARADMIARTELNRANNAGHVWQVRDAGAVAKIWRANQDACDWCAALDGMTISIDRHFFERGERLDIPDPDDPDSAIGMSLDYEDVDHPPLHPNCRCFVEAVWE